MAEGPRRQDADVRPPQGRRAVRFAGLWETWRSPAGSPLETATIITTEPNELVRPIHNRMPAILTPKDEAAWIDPGTDDAAILLPMLRPYPVDAMEAYPVSRHVNSPKNDDPRCIEPVGPDGLFDQA